MDAFLLICILLIIFCVFMAIKSSGARKEDVGNLALKLQNLPNFSAKKTIIKYNVMSIPNGISLDDTTKQICLIQNGQFILKPFSSIIECQIVVDGKTITKTSRGSQALGMLVGGAIGGGLGVLIGGLSASTSEQKKIKNVSIKILFNDLSLPSHEFSLIGVSPATGYKPVSIALKDAEEWDNVLKIILFQSDEERKKQQGEILDV